MKHEHMNVNDEIEQTGPKKLWVTPRLDYLDRTDNGSGDDDDGDGAFDEYTIPTPAS